MLRSLLTNYDFINPFSANVPPLQPLKTSENRRFSDVFRGYTSGALVENGLSQLFHRVFYDVRFLIFIKYFKKDGIWKHT